MLTLARGALAAAAAALVFAVPRRRAAQAPPPPAPDEAAAARAFAEAAKRFAVALEGLDFDVVDEESRCPGVLRGASRRQRRQAVFLEFRNLNRRLADLVEPSVAAFRTDLANAQTRDPALLSGRAAWRQLGRTYAGLPPAGDVCAELAAWRDAGFPRSVTREARREVERIFALDEDRGFERKIRRAAARMREPGVPAADARRFAEPGD